MKKEIWKALESHFQPKDSKESFLASGACGGTTLTLYVLISSATFREGYEWLYYPLMLGVSLCFYLTIMLFGLSFLLWIIERMKNEK